MIQSWKVEIKQNIWTLWAPENEETMMTSAALGYTQAIDLKYTWALAFSQIYAENNDI